MRKLALYFVGIFFLLTVIWSVLPEPWRRGFQSKVGWQAFVSNESAIREYAAKDFSLALRKWGDALAQSQNRPALLYNLSVGLHSTQKMEDANKSYLSVTKDPRADELLKFYSYFNRGTMAQAEKNIDGALIEYQAALDLDPESIETKTNIEMLLAGGQGKGKGDKGQDDPKDDQKKDGEGDKEKDKNEPKKYAPNSKQQPKPFKSEQLDQSDVNKILGEIRQQEQKIRSEYNKREVKESPRDKDW